MLRWLADAAAALAHLHGHVPPIVHGDVKPANLVLTPAGRVVVIDLGGAAREGVARERVAGSRGFQAPESTQAAVTAGDVYGLAATAVVLLGGDLGSGAAAAQLPGLAPPTARAVRRVLARGLSTDPARRQRSVRDLVAELASALGEEAGAAAIDGASAFVGRDEELGLVEEALSERRLVTLVGPGGCGKTRLASEAAALLERGFGGRTVNVGLVAARDEAQVIGVLAAAVGLRDAGEAPLLDLVGDALARHAALMVLDNCEHVLEAARTITTTLLARCPRLSILATSRQALALGGEYVLALAPLAIPAQPDGGAQLARVPSVRLFLDRARRTAPGFAPDVAELDAIGRIVRRLDGIPLAVELAAASSRAATWRRSRRASHTVYRDRWTKRSAGATRCCHPRSRRRSGAAPSSSVAGRTPPRSTCWPEIRSIQPRCRRCSPNWRSGPCWYGLVRTGTRCSRPCANTRLAGSPARTTQSRRRPAI